MSAVQHAPLSQPLRKVSDPAIISKRIASPSPRLATPPSPASSLSTASEEDEIDGNSVEHATEPESDRDPASPPEHETQKILDMDIFRQILELDEEGDHEFSLSMVEEYFKQAEETFRKLDKGFKDKNLPELSTLGHFLKGSSAAIGLKMVQASCEKIQYYGVKRDEEAKKDMKPEEALDKIKGQLEQLREEYAEAKRTLEDWFREHEV